jgi:Second Messenger Oligonucleotide or Dinucleotide Synthetase domain
VAFIIGPMALTVGSAFTSLLSDLPPTQRQRDAASSHGSSIKAALDAKYGTYRFFESGSFRHGTGVRSHSDLDYFASLKGHKPAGSDIALTSLKATLEAKFPSTTVKIRRPAVVLDFASGAETVEVVPGWIKSGEGDKRVYEIPGPRGGWLESAPDAHRAYVNTSNGTPAGGAKGLARLLKAWKYYRVVPVSSFYLEMRAAQYMASETSIDWSIDLRAIIQSLSSHDLGAMNDPSTLTSRFFACSNATNEIDASSKLARALERANRARLAEREGRVRDAFAAWDMFFAGHFPTYG